MRFDGSEWKREGHLPRGHILPNRSGIGVSLGLGQSGVCGNTSHHHCMGREAVSKSSMPPLFFLVWGWWHLTWHGWRYINVSIKTIWGL